ncbi:hypothetical protein GW17_00030517 [Ensete ventricosum]|uniref:Uncharacterized protein n=1 Tax=Ensete ventricosum TaxID=4639 RepID=A0A444E6Z3_ENSVE|nr:hypothetical protein GW17_00030517 [Ensete ventricosum]RZR72971.1 hypothetical protein BHM03_00018873 [Ensete ventricosum]
MSWMIWKKSAGLKRANVVSFPADPECKNAVPSSKPRREVDDSPHATTGRYLDLIFHGGRHSLYRDRVRRSTVVVFVRDRKARIPPSPTCSRRPLASLQDGGGGGTRSTTEIKVFIGGFGETQAGAVGQLGEAAPHCSGGNQYLLCLVSASLMPS